MKRNPASSPAARRDEVDLDGQYRKIGILAVLAALPYQDNAKPLAEEPAVSRNDRRQERMAAA